MRGNFDNTGTLCKLIFRRERVISAIWVAALVLFAVALAPAMAGMFPEAEARAQFAETFDNPIMIAMMGPVYGIDNYTPGAMFSGMMMLWNIIAAAIMNIFFVTRHTRADEEGGRAEVVRSLPVGRLANINAAMLSALAVNSILALLTALGLAAMGVEGMDIAGSLAYGAAVGAAGLVFAAIAALSAQLSSGAGGANSLSFMALGVFYMVRAAGDMQGSEIAACLSPLGLALRTQAYVENNAWPALVLLLLAAAISAAAYKLNSKRDLGQGFIAAKPGRADAPKGLLSPLGLSWRLLRTALLAWLIVMFVLGASYATVITDIDTFVGESPEYLQILGIPPEVIGTMTAADKGKIIVDYFGMFVTLMMSLVCMVPLIGAALKVRSEEREGRAEHIIARAVPRVKYMAGYVLFAYLASVLIQFATAAGLYVSAASVAGDASPFTFGGLMEAFFVYLPAIWVLIGVAVLFAGMLPKAAGAAWGFFGFVAFLSFVGGIPGLLPGWLQNISPMTHIPRAPLKETTAAPLIVLTAIAAALTSAGFVSYGKRDLAP